MIKRISIILLLMLTAPAAPLTGCTATGASKAENAAPSGGNFVAVELLDPETGERFLLEGACEGAASLIMPAANGDGPRRMIVTRMERVSPPETRIWH